MEDDEPKAQEAAPHEPAPAAGAEVAEFRRFLLSITPRLRWVPAIIAANVAVFVAMVASGVDAFAPGGDAVLRWGANHGPATLGGEPWRLLASTFLHFGAIHLAMNMFALWDAGRLVERIFGHARFAAVYLASGLCGSAASLLVHPQVVSAGASGAVFGVYGALGGFLLRQRHAIPPRALAKLRGVALGFVGYNLLYGFTRPGIDAAAHVGGLVAGAAVGVFLSRPLARDRRDSSRGVAIVAAACAAVVALSLLLLPPVPRLPLTTRRLPGFSLDLPEGVIGAETTDYQDGKLILKGVGGTRTGVTVGWQAGPVSREELELVARATASALDVAGPWEIVAYPGPTGASVDTVVMGGGGLTMRLSMLDCGKRSIALLTAGAGADGLHRRILPTIACQPDPRQEDAGVGVVPLRIDLPGWYAADRTGGQVVLTDGRSTLLLRTGGVSTAGMFPDLVRGVFAAMDPGVTVEPSGPHAATLTGSFQGNHVDGWARQVTCPTGGAMLLLLAPDRRTADQVAGLAASARCLLRGESPPAWPDAPVPSP